MFVEQLGAGHCPRYWKLNSEQDKTLPSLNFHLNRNILLVRSIFKAGRGVKGHHFLKN